MTPIVLSIAGSDPSGGAGVQADLKAFSANRVYGAAVLTLLTVQNTQGVFGVQPVPAAFVGAQIDAVFADLRVDAVKIGALGAADIVTVVAERLARHGARNVVLDPVMVAKSGDRLLADEAVEALRTRLLPLADVVTPNLPEAADLLRETEVAREDEMPSAAARLLALGAKAVLLKGGHLAGADSADLLATPQGEDWLRAPRVVTHATHGTGCTLSAALAARLAHGDALPEAARAAKAYLSRALASGAALRVGSGHGPVHHFADWWPAGAPDPR